MASYEFTTVKLPAKCGCCVVDSTAAVATNTAQIRSFVDDFVHIRTDTGWVVLDQSMTLQFALWHQRNNTYESEQRQRFFRQVAGMAIGLGTADLGKVARSLGGTYLQIAEGVIHESMDKDFGVLNRHQQVELEGGRLAVNLFRHRNGDPYMHGRYALTNLLTAIVTQRRPV